MAKAIPPDVGPPPDARFPMITPPPTRAYAKRRRAVVLVFVILAAVVLVVGQAMRNDEAAGAGPTTAPRAATPEQQTCGFEGCVANSWPHLRGKRYAGNPVD